jgi:phospholipid/cholesterol/gamma-HCH transport system substrate-binding protein
MQESDPRFFWLKKKILLFFLVSILGMGATVVFIGVERGLFISKYRIYFTIERGTGLFESMPVKLSGFKIGKIESLELADDAKVKVILSINQKYRQWIRQNSMALLSKEGLIGESVIEITLGSMDKPIVKPNSEIKFYRTRGLEDIAEDMLPVLTEIKQIVDYVNNPEGDFKQILNHAHRLTDELHVTVDNVNKLLQETHGKIADLEKTAVGAIKSVDALAGNLDKSVRQVDGRLPAVMDKLENSLDNVEKASSSLKTVLERSASSVPNMLLKGEDTLDDTREVVKSLKRTWPIRAHTPDSGENLLHGDSHE